MMSMESYSQEPTPLVQPTTSLGNTLEQASTLEEQMEPTMEPLTRHLRATSTSLFGLTDLGGSITELTELSDSTDETSLARDFDEPICMLAAARLIDRQSNGRDKGRTSRAYELRYGNGGSPAKPSPESAYGLLNTIWNVTRVPTKSPLRRIRNIYENRKFRRMYQDTNATTP